MLVRDSSTSTFPHFNPEKLSLTETYRRYTIIIRVISHLRYFSMPRSSGSDTAGGSQIKRRIESSCLETLLAADLFS